MLNILLYLRFTLRFVHFLLNFLVLLALSLDFMDFSEFILAPSLVYFVLDLVSHLLFPREVALVQFVELLALAKFTLLLL